MKNILILGSLPKTEIEHKKYEIIITICKKYTENILSPIDTAKFQGTAKERYHRAFQTVQDADIIIGEQSLPSTGQGMEIREAINQNKKVIIIAQEGSKVSGLIRGCPEIQAIIFYNKKNLTSLLHNEIRKHCK